jgi:hypothetical protein
MVTVARLEVPPWDWTKHEGFCRDSSRDFVEGSLGAARAQLPKTSGMVQANISGNAHSYFSECQLKSLNHVSPIENNPA